MSDVAQMIEHDIRQANQWAESLKLYGWKSFKTTAGINVFIMNTFLGGFAKLQKPAPFDKQGLKEIEAICKKNHALFLKVEPSLGQDIKLLEDSRYKVSREILSPTKTIYIDLLKTEADLWQDISESGQYSIHRAQREGAKVEFFRHPTEEKLTEFYEIHRQTTQAKHFSLKSYADLKSRVDSFGDESFLVMVYDSNGKLAAGKFYLGYLGNIWYVYGGTANWARVKNKAGYELMWQSILYFKSLGYKVLDLEGVYDPRFPRYLTIWGGFSHFKEKFGGVVVEFPMPRIKYFSPVMRAIDKVYGGSVSV